MKTLFVVSSKKVEEHVGEEYDSILEVDDQPTTEVIQDLANRVRGRIRKLWMEQEEDDPDRKVVVSLEAATPYNTMLIDLQLVMKEAEGVVVELPYLEDMDMEVHDTEAKKLLEKLDNKQ